MLSAPRWKSTPHPLKFEFSDKQTETPEVSQNCLVQAKSSPHILGKASQDQMCENDDPLHVHDLPQIYQKPDPKDLIQALEGLIEVPPSFNQASANIKGAKARVDPEGVPRYLTSIVSSSLDWIDESTRERVWNLASLRLTERSGRNAMHDMTRSFQVTDELTIRIHEPSLTGDNLGLKTWTSSLLLSRLLPALRKSIPHHDRVLELGAGTGLLGVSIACLLQADVLLTDLPEVMPNLQRNLQLNEDIVELHHGKVTSQAIDWSDPTHAPEHSSDRFRLIFAADPIYSPHHPRILVDAISRWLEFDTDARVVLSLPLRGHYDQERSDLRRLLDQARLQIVEEGITTGFDDWYAADGKPAEVECSWSIWRPILM